MDGRPDPKTNFFQYTTIINDVSALSTAQTRNYFPWQSLTPPDACILVKNRPAKNRFSGMPQHPPTRFHFMPSPLVSQFKRPGHNCDQAFRHPLNQFQLTATPIK